MTRLEFELEATAAGSRARAARFRTLHNEVLTPTFMPVGTHAAVRAQSREDLLASGTQVLLANTYHLLLRPGVEIFEKFGGIHRFMNWPRAVLTDSGGFQIFSLPGSRTLREEGAAFTSYVDRTTIHLSPERSIATQKAIGADIMMVLDQCVPATVERGVARDAMELTHRWALRSLAARADGRQALFGIVQGASYNDLRVESARAIAQMPFDGFAIGGLAVGESATQREDCTALVTEHLPQDRPRYLMGVGTTRDLIEAVHRGVDMFDCILPTALAKQGVAFTSVGRRDLRRAAYRGMEGPIDPACDCHACRTFSIAYLFHLNRVRETLGWQLLGSHNIHFYMRLMRRMREHILAGTWLDFYRAQRDVLDVRDSYGRAPTHITKAQRAKLSMQLGRYEVVVYDDIGHIRDRISGEVMHPVSDPSQEARLLYVEQARLVERLQAADQTSAAAPLVVWDVGLGAAANAMAAIHAIESAAGEPGAPARADIAPRVDRRRLTLVSFENDLDALNLALRHPRWFRHLHHAAPRQLLEQGCWSGRAGIDWLLLHGDFAVCKSEAPPPDIVFFDPFSFKTDRELWTLAMFRALAELCADKAVELFTYSHSTSVRAAMLAAGFFVAKGVGTGAKAETTIALSARAAALPHRRELLGSEWLGKWRRSDAQAPFGVTPDEQSWREAVSAHPQFQ
ncbi:MAG: tRNA guanosine(34) transglycosylase Tgt [Steroidobacteraceae bacterium]